MTTTLTTRTQAAWFIAGYDTGEHVGVQLGRETGYAEGYIDGFTAGIPEGRQQVEDELSIAGRPILAAIQKATGHPLHRLEPLEALRARRRQDMVLKVTPPRLHRLVANWDELWLAGRPASEYLEEATA